MKRRSAIGVTILTILLVAYALVLCFIFPDKIFDVFYVLPIIVVAMFIMFLLGNVIFLNRKTNENINLRNELKIQKQLYYLKKENRRDLSGFLIHFLS